LAVHAGLIPIGMPEKIAQENAILVGNAAAQVKPLTGGGLAFLSICAPLAGKIAAQGPEALCDYDEMCRRMIGEEMEFQEKARRTFLGLKPQLLEEAVKALTNPKLADFLANSAEIDHFSSLRWKILTRFDLWPLFLPFAHLLGR